jgi:hypothetical protein
MSILDKRSVRLIFLEIYINFYYNHNILRQYNCNKLAKFTFNAECCSLLDAEG